MAVVVGAGALLAAGVSSVAAAQAIDTSTAFTTSNVQADSFNRGQNVSVLERPRPDYQAEGIHEGGFMLYPKISGSVVYDDNIYATHSGAIGDTIAVLAPELDFQSTWSRNGIAGYLRDTQSLYVSHTAEDTNQYAGGLSGLYQFGESKLTGDISSGLYALPRTAASSGATSKHPIQYVFSNLHAALAHTFNRLRLTASVEDQKYNYQNGETPGGAPVIESGLSHNDLTGTGKAEYAISPNTAVFTAVAFNTHNYDEKPPAVLYNSDSSGSNVVGGINFDLTHLMRGEVQAGYMEQHYTSPLFHDIKGLSAKAQVEWFPTQLTTVTFTALRAIGDSTIINSAGYVNETAGVQVDHELLRNVILGANATWNQNVYSGISRTDRIESFGAHANWLITRRVGLNFAYAYIDQNSTGIAKGPDYKDNRVSVTAILQF